MSRFSSVGAILIWTVVWFLVAFNQPKVLSDANTFLRYFVGNEFLDFTGIIVTITLASIVNLLVEMSKLESKVGFKVFVKSRDDVKHSALSLIAALIVSVITVVSKPLICDGERSQALLNGFVLGIILFIMLILIDVTIAAFQLEPVLLSRDDT
jgi:hypothetical protein